MAKYEHLPIFKKAFDLTLYFEKIVRNFSRYHKYSKLFSFQTSRNCHSGGILLIESTVVITKKIPPE